MMLSPADLDSISYLCSQVLAHPGKHLGSVSHQRSAAYGTESQKAMLGV